TGGRPLRYSSVGTRLVAPVGCAPGRESAGDFFANPNAPSGTWVDPSVVSALASRTDALVLVDEAYVDFADDSCLGLLSSHENVLIPRTLSKGYGLAGLRFGYAIGSRAIIEQMAKVKDSYNCDAIAIAAAAAALDDRSVRACAVDESPAGA
ncbi:MAG: aminotransferase class I/II-fold pyridoxal phosphate-dependent enzyme, partial [Vicinamibacterales bacterium]